MQHCLLRYVRARNKASAYRIAERMINFDGKRSATNFDPTISDFYPESVKVAVQNVLSRDPNMPAVITSDILSLYAPGVTVDTSLVQKQVLDYYMPVYAYLYELYHSKRDTLLNKNDICLSSSLEDKLTRSSEARPEGMLSSSKVTSPPVFIGISAPQGCGKTTLTNTLIKLFARNNLRAIAISLDDFYLRGADQEVLASEHRENPLLQLRGNAGTHDMPLLMHTMQALQSRFNCSNTGTFVQIPRYDKSLRSGKGDRAPTADWLSIPSAEPVDIVLVEGWMLGFSPVPSSALLEGTYYTHANIQQINALLEQYETFHQMFDGWLVVALEDINIVYEWRLEAEKRMIRAGKPGMTDAQVEDFVKRFMPAYRNYLPRLHASGHGPLPRKPTILSSVFTDMNATDDAAKDVSVDMRCPALLIQMNHRRLPTHAWFV